MSLSSSVRPAPTRPPMPTTSPACTSKRRRLDVRVPRDAAHLEQHVAAALLALGVQLPDLAADHVLDERVLGVSEGSPTATVRPSESTVTRSPIRLTSSRRCEM